MSKWKSIISNKWRMIAILSLSINLVVLGALLWANYQFRQKPAEVILAAGSKIYQIECVDYYDEVMSYLDDTAKNKKGSENVRALYAYMYCHKDYKTGKDIDFKPQLEEILGREIN